MFFVCFITSSVQFVYYNKYDLYLIRDGFYFAVIFDCHSTAVFVKPDLNIMVVSPVFFHSNL